MFLAFPQYNPTSAYRPVKWRLAVGTPLAVEVAQVEVFINGVSTATFNKSPIEVIAAFTYVFDIDIQSIVRDALEPFSTSVPPVFGQNNQPYLGLLTGTQASVNISVTYLYRDVTTNQLTDLGITDISPNVDVNITTRQHTDDQALTEFEPLFLDTDKRFLTNAHNPKETCLGQNEWLTFYADAGANEIRVTTFDVTGGQLQQGTFFVDTSAQNEFQSIGVGANNLNAVTWDTGNVTISNLVSFYTVELIGLLGEPYLEIRRYNVVNCCDNNTRIHFLNRLGGADAYNFRRTLNSDFDVKTTTGSKALEWDVFAATPHNVRDNGAFTYYTEQKTTYEIQTGYLQEDEAKYVTEIATSTKTYRETDNGLIPCIVNPKTYRTKTDDRSGIRLVQLVFEVQDSNDVISQYV